MNKTLVFDPKQLRLLWRHFQQEYLSHTEVILNIFVSILVIAFISYQTLTLLTRPNRAAARRAEKDEALLKKVTKDTASGEDSGYADVHDHVFKQKEIPFHLPLLDDDETLRNSQFFYEQMKLRRSVRSFSTRPVSLKVITNIIKTAGTSPSMGNSQPWIFCVIVRDDVKHDIRQVLEADERDNYTRRAGADWVVGVSQLEDTWSRPYITDAPYLLAVCHEVFKEVDGRKQRSFQYNELSTAIAVGVLLAAIQNVGLGTVVTSPLNAGYRISRLLKRPDNESLLLLLPLGYPSGEATVPDLRKKGIENIIKLY